MIPRISAVTARIAPALSAAMTNNAIGVAGTAGGWGNGTSKFRR